MFRHLFLVFLIVLLSGMLCGGQVLKFGACADVKTMQYFDLEQFLGEWIELERFPIWFEHAGACAHKRIRQCGRRIEIEHVYVKDGVQFVLALNSTYAPGADAIFAIQKSNIDPVGIPLTVISTDYSNYALVYGCKYHEQSGIKYISAWILSRETSLPEEIQMKAYKELNSIPSASTGYLEKVDHSDDRCRHHWTARVDTVEYNV